MLMLPIMHLKTVNMAARAITKSLRLLASYKATCYRSYSSIWYDLSLEHLMQCMAV